MRTLALYGGPQGVSASQRLKHKLSTTAGMLMLSNTAPADEGYLVSTMEDEDQRVIHSTSWATENFSSTAVLLKRCTLQQKIWSAQTVPLAFLATNAVEFVADSNKQETTLSPILGTNSIGQLAQSNIYFRDKSEESCASAFQVPLDYEHDQSNANTCLESNLASVHRLCAAAVIVQKLWRGLQSRHLFLQLKVQRSVRERAAIVIQAGFRRIQKWKQFRLMRNAALTIQSHWRAIQIRCCLPQLKFVCNAQERAEIVIQAGFRMTLKWKEYQIMRNAAVTIQKHWRESRSKDLYQLKGQQLAQEKAPIVMQTYVCITKSKQYQSVRSGAIIFQKHFRVVQSRHLLDGLQVEQSATDRSAIVIQAHCCRIQKWKQYQNIWNAAVTIPKHWKAWQSEHLLYQLKFQKSVLERSAVVIQAHVCKDQRLQQYQRIKQSAVVQKHWRATQNRHLYQLKVHQERTAMLIQARVCRKQVQRQSQTVGAADAIQQHWRATQSSYQLSVQRSSVFSQSYLHGHVLQVELKKWNNVTPVIQKKWREYQHSCNSNRPTQHQGTLHNLDYSWRDFQAVSVIQEAQFCVFFVKKRLQSRHVAATLIQGKWRAYRNSVPPVVAMESLSCTSRSSLVSCPNCDLASRRLLEFELHFLVLTKGSISSCLGGRTSEIQFTGENLDGSTLDCSLPSLGKDRDLTSVDSEISQPIWQQEDWNYVPIDNLDECLDTRLARLKLISNPEKTVSVLDIPEFSESTQNLERCKKVDGNARMHCRPDRVVEEESVSQSSQEEINNEPFNAVDFTVANSLVAKPAASYELSGLTYTSYQRSGSQSSDTSLEWRTSTQIFNQGINAQRYIYQKRKLNDKQLQQFAQAFLLKRCVSHQQEQARLAPPFPSPFTSKSKGSVQAVKLHLTLKRPTVSQDFYFCGNNAIQGNKCCLDDPTGLARESTSHQVFYPQASPNSGVKSLICHETQGTDVVVDVMMLLRKLENECGQSGFHCEEAFSTEPLPRTGDIEEGLVYGNNRWDLSGHEWHHSSIGLIDTVGIRRLVLPDVNVVLLVLIAVVVYTKTICYGVLHGARETLRKL